MTSSPKTSRWRSTPQALRHRKAVTITLSDEAREHLEELAPDRQRSAFVEELIMNAEPPSKARKR